MPTCKKLAVGYFPKRCSVFINQSRLLNVVVEEQGFGMHHLKSFRAVAEIIRYTMLEVFMY